MWTGGEPLVAEVLETATVREGLQAVDGAGFGGNGVHVVRAAGEVFARYGFLPEFWMVAPEQDGRLDPARLAEAMLVRMKERFHYCESCAADAASTTLRKRFGDLVV